MTQRYLWILDAGHAPDKAGKRSPVVDGLRFEEWIGARRVVDMIAAELDIRGIAYHVLTPRTEWDMHVVHRAELANNVKAHVNGAGLRTVVLVSVHMNAHGNGSELTDAHGATVLYRGHPDMAEELLGHICSRTGFKSRGARYRDDLGILNRTSMPAVLSESGFYTHRGDLDVLMSSAGLQSIASAHVDWIAEMETSE